MSLAPANKAAAVTNANANKRPTTDEYVASRIQASADKGYNNCKCWLNDSQVEDVVLKLEALNYTVDVEKDPEGKPRSQLQISW